MVVQRLLDAGWRAVGKTHTVELAYGGWGTNRAVGAPWNPWDAKVHRAPGGSSSGSAVAVAAGLCDAALGSDTGGSVRIPAAVCGVVGLKPGRGLVSLKGVHPLGPALDTVGALARDVATAARMLGVISGPDGARGRARGPSTPRRRSARRSRAAGSPPSRWSTWARSTPTSAGSISRRSTGCARPASPCRWSARPRRWTTASPPTAC